MNDEDSDDYTRFLPDNLNIRDFLGNTLSDSSQVSWEEIPGQGLKDLNSKF